jgi:hypothetical protein
MPSKSRVLSVGLLLVVTLGLTSCGLSSSGPPNTGGGSSGGGTPPAQSTPAGVWYGSDTSFGYIYLGFVDESGNFDLYQDEFHFHYSGVFTISGNNGTQLNGGGTAFAESFSVIVGPAVGVFTVSGTYQPGSNMTLTIAGGNLAPRTVNLTYDGHDYLSASSLATITGNYIQDVGDFLTNPATISADGTIIIGSSLTSDCTYGGKVTLMDPQYNLYRVQLIASQCSSAASYLEGATFNGYASARNTGYGPIDNSAVFPGLTILATSTIGGGIHFDLDSR